MNESDFMANVIELATTLHWRVHHCRPAQGGNGRWSTPIQGHAGFPDLVLARAGRVVFAELKSEKGELSPHQRDWQSDLVGQEYNLWRPGDIEFIADILTTRERVEW
jgi:hypothetical protein